MQPIQNSSISPFNISQLSLQEPALSSTDTHSSSFQDLLIKSMSETSQLSLQADQNIYTSLTSGDITNAEALTSLKKADLALKTMVQFRNKFLDMYQEFQQIRF